MRLGLGLNITANSRRGGTPAFSPTSLYSSGSQGIWLDPSDLTTMFSDRAGTTPVTAPGTVVGLRLDKSKGLTLGAELVTNGDFSGGTTTGWTAQSATLSVDTGRLKVITTASSQGATQVLSGLVVGKTYKISLDVTVGGSAWAITLGLAFAQGQGFSSGSQSTSQTYSLIYTCTNTANNVFSLFCYSAGTTFFDNISVRELAGNHAVAPTDAARPVYGVEPKGGRRNLLTWSEDFRTTAAAGETRPWTAANVTATIDQAVAPDGTNTADLLQATGTNSYTGNIATGLTASTTYTLSVYVKSASGATTTNLTFYTNNFGTLIGSQTFTTTSEWQRITLTATTGTLTGNTQLAIGTSNSFSTGESLYVWGAQLELGSTATPYQRVTIAENVTEAGVPTCHYCRYDGANNSMSTSAIDFTATDKMSVFAGVRKLSDAASGVVVESGTDVSLVGGSFLLAHPRSGSVNAPSFLSRGTSTSAAISSSNAYPAPRSSVITGTSDISGDLTTLRENGTSLGQSTADQGTGNYGNYPLYIGRRNNATLPLNGRDFGIIIVGKAASAGEITDTETWLAAKTSGVTL